jgi:hypothetical protein
MGKQDGQSTLEWAITAAVVLGTLATQRDHPLIHGAGR